MTTVPALRTAGEADIDNVADLIADSFDHIDVIHFLVPDPDLRRPVTRDWYRLYVEHAIGGAGQVVMTADGAAAAVWFDRTGAPSEPEDYDKRLAELAGEHLDHFQHLDRQMEARHPTDPHWHLLFLAVRPDRWSQGLGSALMDHTHARLDAEGVPAYLEATSEQNRKLYRRHGYTDMIPPVIEVSAVAHLYRMWRPTQNH
ncbi:GNAT family N-acetyltransferase [Phytohabitans aurantiacus]|uniref:N-acetyltransferase n=1 Tax=Phytohabitans aurantiacus TaxID=3016789 RepID=A0ABQ5R116_9ACTN|nr:GNAT family N-acetyltransferase [Phytohabitans aurantiacus]GLH99871.1 N-acetyltransferase [Phytohabitans aurantiacus]